MVATGAGLFTVTVKLQLSLFPAASVATQSTGVTPLGKTDPDAGVAVTVTPGQLSVAATWKFTVAEQLAESTSVTMFAGQITAGFSLSFTVTVKEQLSLFPAASVATL